MITALTALLEAGLRHQASGQRSLVNDRRLYLFRGLMQPKGGAKIVKVGGGRECNLLSRRRRTAGEMDKPALGFGEFSEELMG